MRRQRVITIIVLLISVMLNVIYSSQIFAQREAGAVEYTSGELRDPLRSPLPLEEEKISLPAAPVEEEVVSLPSLSVQGMVWGVEPAKAIINDEVVGIGDTILDAQVLDIKKEGVYLLYKGKEFIVKPQ